MPDNAADRKDIRRREKEAKIATAQRAQVVHQIMSTVQGREWMWHTLAECGVFRQTFVPDAAMTAFNEGKRAIGLALLADIMTTCPDQYINAQRESNERHATWERRSSPEPDGRDTGREPDAGEASGYLNDHDDWNDYDRQADAASFRNETR